MSDVRLYFRYLGISLQGQMEYRASMLMLALGQFLITGTEFFAVWALFDRFGSLEGWSLPEVALLYGMVNVAFALSDAFGRGFDFFATQVKSGDFDRILLRPRSTALQIAASTLELSRVGRLLQGAAVLAWALIALDLAWTLPKALLLVGSIASGAALFTGLFVLQATLAFWTTEGLEIANVFTYGGVETAQYPLPIYERWFRRFFTFVVPLACINYLPSVAITGQEDPLGTPPWVGWLAPLVGFAFLAVCLQVWRAGVRRYRSTGS